MKVDTSLQPMASKRLARLNEQLKRELAELIQTELRDPRVGLVSVTAVQIAADLGSPALESPRKRGSSSLRA